MSDPTNQGAQRLKRVSPYSAPPSASTVAVAPTLTARSQVSSSVRAMLPPVRIGRIGVSGGFGGGALNVLLHCDERRPTEGPLQFLQRPGMGIPLQREAVALVTMVEVASTVVKSRDASGELLRFRVVRATRPGSL
jgi:hypothetical protein